MSVINAIWWPTSAKDSDHGVIVQFGTIAFKVPNFISSTSAFKWFWPLSYRAENQGTTNLQLAFLNPPMIASELTFSDIVYTASPGSGQTNPQWNDGHYVMAQLELFGCDNYDVTQSKSLTRWSISRA